MVKVIARGDEYTRIHTCTCSDCGCYFSFTLEDCTLGLKKDEYMFSLKCPDCKMPTHFSASQFRLSNFEELKKKVGK